MDTKELYEKLAAVLNEPLTDENMEAMAADHTKYVLDKMMPHIQAECNRARIDELAHMTCCDHSIEDLADFADLDINKLDTTWETHVCRGDHYERIKELQQLMKGGE